MKPDLFLHPRVISEINMCTMAKPSDNIPYIQESNRPNFCISYHITAETRAIYKNLPSGSSEHTRSAHTLAFIPKCSSYDAYTTKAGYYTFINFQLAESPGVPLSKIPFSIEVNAPVRVERLMTDAARIWRRKEPGYLYECGTCLQAVLGYMETQINRSYFTSEQSKSIEQALAYINEHFASDRVTVAAPAKDTGVSEVYFRRKFKEYTGMSPSRYIRHRRIEWAKKLIASAMFTMEAVAYQSGFGDFSRIL